MTLEYTNEDDRAYGLAGMAISLAALDAIDNIVEFSLDADGPMVTFSNSFYFTSAPAVSPKAVWENLMRNFHITASMVISNVMARSIVRLHEDVPLDVISKIEDEIKAEGRETCGLDDDEVENFFNKTFVQQRRIYLNPRLAPAIDELARVFSTRRRLSGLELRDELGLLAL